MKIEGTAAIVTGGASGLGGAPADLLAAAGAKVTILDLNTELGDLWGHAMLARFHRGEPDAERRDDPPGRRNPDGTQMTFAFDTSGMSDRALDIADRVEAFVPDVVAPYEQDSRRGAHGPPEEMSLDLKDAARKVGVLRPISWKTGRT